MLLGESMIWRCALFHYSHHVVEDHKDRLYHCLCLKCCRRWTTEDVIAEAGAGEVQRLRDALGRVRGGVMLMVSEPQKTGFLQIIDAALTAPAQEAQKEKENDSIRSL